LEVASFGERTVFLQKTFQEYPEIALGKDILKKFSRQDWNKKS